MNSDKPVDVRKDESYLGAVVNAIRRGNVSNITMKGSHAFTPGSDYGSRSHNPYDKPAGDSSHGSGCSCGRYTTHGRGNLPGFDNFHEHEYASGNNYLSGHRQERISYQQGGRKNHYRLRAGF